MKHSCARSFTRGMMMAAALAAYGTGAAAAEVHTGLGTVFKQVITEENVIFLQSPPANFEWQPLPGADGLDDSAFALVVGGGVLVTVRFAAESLCYGGGTDVGWCSLRILIDGVEAEPAPADYAFDSTNNGARGAAAWQGHAMERHLCIENSAGGTRVVPVQVQWSMFDQNQGADFPTFRLDDWSLTIESAIAFRGCDPLVIQ